MAKIKLDSYDSLSIEKRLTLHDDKIHIKSVLNKDKNNYYYKLFLEKSFSISIRNLLAKKQSQWFQSIIMIWRDKNSKRKVLCWKKTYKNLGC